MTGSPSDFQQQVGWGTRLDMAAQAAAIIREKRKRLIPNISSSSFIKLFHFIFSSPGEEIISAILNIISYIEYELNKVKI